MSHFVCEGDCKGVADQAGICQSDFCNKKGEDLIICGCEDGEHKNEKSQDSSPEIESA